MATLRTYCYISWLAIVAFSLIPFCEALGKKPKRIVVRPGHVRSSRAKSGQTTMRKLPLKRDTPARGTPARSKPITLDEQALRQAIYDTAAQFLNKTERTNRNDAPWIARINKFNHLPAQALYCASGLYYAYAKNGAWLTVKSVGYVKVYFRDKEKIVYQRGQRGNQRNGPAPRKMDFVSLYASHVEGLADDRWDDDDEYVYTIGFNTTGGQGTKGGCYLNRRRKDEIKAISNHLTPYLKQWTP